MNTITLNGVRSDTIQGLLIQSLPPISKPPMRVNVEEIDGRNGDIITDLGYQAYDKTITIGLRGSFDINDVISFFNSEGTVVFSNEPDKYYRYKIYQQIDFERLIRYRVANVTMHVQPFKYSTAEKTLRAFSGDGSVTIFNMGNYISAPIISITGSGDISLSLNGVQIFTIALGDQDHITIDTERMEATKDGNLMNRYVSGDYDDFVFQSGKNILTWTGTVAEISIANYSRWL